MVKKLKLSISLLLFLLVCGNSFAGGIGCKLSDNKIYTDPIFLSLGMPSYTGSTYLTLSPSDCITNNMGNCQVCKGNLLGLVCLTGFIGGTQVNYAFNCDIDSGAIMLLIFTGTSGFYFVKRKSK